MRDTKSKKEKQNSSQELPGVKTTTENEFGVVRIHENVIASLVRKATCSVEGVVRLAGSTLVDNIAGFVGSRKIHDRAIKVVINEDSVQIEVKVNLSFGAFIPEVAQNIQDSVRETVEKLTGMKVRRVDVIVQEIEEIKEQEDSESEEVGIPE